MKSINVRIQSIDLLRGMVMIVMALDHVRDYFHSESFVIDPTDLSKTNIALFTTRWVTHFCAPIFMFLAGTSAFFIGQKKTKKELSSFLLSRGLWLIFMELTIISFGWSFKLDLLSLDLAVIWALGACMIFLSGLIWLPYNAILIIGLLLVFGHNSLDTFHISGNSILAFVWKIFHEQGYGNIGPFKIFVFYPILSWIGVMALGYCLGVLYVSDFDISKRKKILTSIGMSMIVIFILLRFSNIYGDAELWSKQSCFIFSVISFLNTSKYPPSLLYLCMTIGPALLFLAYSENIKMGISDKIKIFGRVPMFFYILHLYLIHFGAILLLYFQGFNFTDTDHNLVTNYGLSLQMTYLVWIIVIVLLYPFCKWYDLYKSSHKENKWLSYL